MVNLKKFLILHKKDALLYWKQDPHWTPTGDYWTYYSIVEALNGYKITNENQISLSYSKEDIKGQTGQSNMLGETPKLEIAKRLEFTDNTFIDNKSEYSKSISEASGQFKKYFRTLSDLQSIFIFANKNENLSKKVLFYADSQFWPGNKFNTILLAQHFKNLVYVWSYEPLSEIEKAVAPDIIVQAFPERTVLILLKNLKSKLPLETK